MQKVNTKRRNNSGGFQRPQSVKFPFYPPGYQNLNVNQARSYAGWGNAAFWLLALLVVVIGVFGIWAFVDTRGCGKTKSCLTDPDSELELHNVKITGYMNISMVDEINEGEWSVINTKKREKTMHNGQVRVVVEEDLSIEKVSLYLNVGEEVHILVNMDDPNYHNKDFRIFSGVDEPHRIIITSAGGFWDTKTKQKKTVLFDSLDGCYIIFRIVDQERVMIVSEQGTSLCTDDLSECQGAMAMGSFHNLKVTGELDISKVRKKK